MAMQSAVWLVDWLMRFDNNHETAFRELLAKLAEGGSLADFCRDESIRQGFLLAWIRSDRDRSMRFDLAMLDRKLIDQEWGRDVVVETATRVALLEPPSHAERLKAASMLIGTDKEQKGGSGVTINILRFSDEPVQVPQGYTLEHHNPS